MKDPHLCDSNAHPLPADHVEVYACDDCGDEFPVAQMTDTIAGVYCPECAAVFLAAARRLVALGTKKGADNA